MHSKQEMEKLWHADMSRTPHKFDAHLYGVTSVMSVKDEEGKLLMPIIAINSRTPRQPPFDASKTMRITNRTALVMTILAQQHMPSAGIRFDTNSSSASDAEMPGPIEDEQKPSVVELDEGSDDEDQAAHQRRMKQLQECVNQPRAHANDQTDSSRSSSLMIVLDASPLPCLLLTPRLLCSRMEADVDDQLTALLPLDATLDILPTEPPRIDPSLGESAMKKKPSPIAQNTRGSSTDSMMAATAVPNTGFSLGNDGWTRARIMM
jgi:hypothetical protein